MARGLGVVTPARVRKAPVLGTILPRTEYLEAYLAFLPALHTFRVHCDYPLSLHQSRIENSCP